MTELTDARGVVIAPGDTALYGFGVGRSVAMAEAVVLGETTHVRGASEEDCPGCDRYRRGEHHLKVSLTPSGRVRLRVIRRSYSSGEKPVVDVAPDRMVVLKPDTHAFGPGLDASTAYLPPSPLPTQAEEARDSIRRGIEYHEKNLADPEANMRDHWEGDRDRFVAWHTAELAKEHRKLRDLDAWET
jgi:hypothetical protein